MHVIPDIAPFVDNTGTVIEGRRQWREHLKKNDLVEYGHSDIASATSQHEKKRTEIAERTRKLSSEIIGKWDAPVEIPENTQVKTRLWCKVAERLEGREKPARKQLIKVILEELKREKRNS